MPKYPPNLPIKDRHNEEEITTAFAYNRRSLKCCNETQPLTTRQVANWCIYGVTRCTATSANNYELEDNGTVCVTQLNLTKHLLQAIIPWCHQVRKPHVTREGLIVPAENSVIPVWQAEVSHSSSHSSAMSVVGRVTARQTCHYTQLPDRQIWT